MKYTVVIFDLDGTLLDTSKGIFNGINHVIKQLGLDSLNQEKLSLFVGPPLWDSFKTICGLPDERCTQAIEIFRKEYIQTGIYEAQVYEGIKELLKWLRNEKIKIGIATLKREDMAKQIMRYFGLEKYFDVIIGDRELHKFTKEDTINMALEILGEVDRTKVLMIGDSPYDAIGAENAKVDFLAVTYGFGFTSLEAANSYANISVASTVKDIYQSIEL